MRWLYLLVVILVATLALQAGLLAFAMYVLLGVVLLSRYLSRSWVDQLVIDRATGVLEPAEIGDSVEIRLLLTNRGSLPIAWILIEDLLPEQALKQRPPRLSVKGKRLRMARIGSGQTITMKYTLVCEMRGYYQIGPTLLETGDFFGLHRRHRVVARALYLLVYPRVVPLPSYDFISRRPIGEVTMGHRLFEDPTRHAGVRPYMFGDPLQRVHWRATARTGELQCRVYEPTTLAGASVLVDFHQDAYPKRGEPYRSELAITTAASICYALTMLNQQVGLASNGRDAADRIRLDIEVQTGTTDEEPGYETRESARASGVMCDESQRLRPLMVPTRRGIEQFQLIREALARLELSDGLSFVPFLFEVTPYLPRDATVIAILAAVPIETSIALGNLRRQGFAVTAILIGLSDDDRSQAHGRLLAEGVKDVRAVNSEAELGQLGRTTEAFGGVPYNVTIDLV